MKISRFLGFAAAALASVALPGGVAVAQIGGAWVDEYGRTMTLTLTAAPRAPLEAGERTAEQIASAFRTLCYGTGYRRVDVAAAVGRLGWDMTYIPVQISSKSPAEVGGWRTPDAALHVTDGASFPKVPQCSFVVRSRAVVSQDALTDAVSAALGMQPSNLNKKFKKNGKADKYWRPEWRPTNGPAAGQAIMAGKNPAVRDNDNWQLVVYTARASRRR